MSFWDVFKSLARAKVSKLDDSLVAHENIGAFDISMHDIVLIGEPNR
jgi:hypothetical protein